MCAKVIVRELKEWKFKETKIPNRLAQDILHQVHRLSKKLKTIIIYPSQRFAPNSTTYSHFFMNLDLSLHSNRVNYLFKNIHLNNTESCLFWKSESGMFHTIPNFFLNLHRFHLFLVLSRDFLRERNLFFSENAWFFYFSKRIGSISPHFSKKRIGVNFQAKRWFCQAKVFEPSHSIPLTKEISITFRPSLTHHSINSLPKVSNLFSKLFLL